MLRSEQGSKTFRGNIDAVYSVFALTEHKQ